MQKMRGGLEIYLEERGSLQNTKPQSNKPRRTGQPGTEKGKGPDLSTADTQEDHDAEEEVLHMPT